MRVFSRCSEEVEFDETVSAGDSEGDLVSTTCVEFFELVAA